MIVHPYVGLRAFNREESAIFFGREEHTDALLDALTRQQFLAVVGLSGSGKSSLVKCGLIPALEAGYLSGAGTHWHIADFRPGSDPFKNLADALHEQADLPAGLENTLLNSGAFSLHEHLAEHPLPKSCKLLLICDQFEELFRYSEQKTLSSNQQTQAAAFVALLLASSRAHTLADGRISNGIYLVLTMRSDFLGECAQFVGLAEAINQGLYLTPRLNREQLRLAIEEPALIAGGEAEPALVVQLLEDVGNNPDQLPLLQHVLMRLWDEDKECKHLTLEHYRNLGGLSEALNSHAEQALSELTPDGQKLAETIFRALTEREGDDKDTRRPVAVSELLDSSQTDLNTLNHVTAPFRRSGRNFLMPPSNVQLTPNTVLDISHESLIRQWVRLNEWGKLEAASAAMYLRLLDSAENHREYWRGTDLELAQTWRQNQRPNENWARRYALPSSRFASVKQFIDSSRQKEDEEKARTARQELQRKQFFGALIALGFAIAFASWGILERNRAQIERNRAQTERNRAQIESEKSKIAAQRALQAEIEAKKQTLLANSAREKTRQAQVELTALTLRNLIENKSPITPYLKEVYNRNQQDGLLAWLTSEISAWQGEKKQIWTARLAKMTSEQIMDLVQIIVQKRLERLDVLAQEISRPSLPLALPNIPEMKSIPAGTFVMGCQSGKSATCDARELPAHTVNLRAFEIGKYEVTQSQWVSIMGSNPSKNKDCPNGLCPVERVSWNDIQIFIQKINAKTGLNYRLPSEAEWEYACKAGQDTVYCGGNSPYSVAWYKENSDWKTHRVGSKLPNAWGLYDMSGNVYECVQDNPNDSYSDAPSDGSAYKHSQSSWRVIRGGSYNDYAHQLRTTDRKYGTENSRRYEFLGFRLARSLP